MTESTYFLAICPDHRVKDQIHRQKEWVYQKYGVKGAFRSSAHITLQMPFKLGINKKEKLVNELNSFTKSEIPFDIHLNGFGCFEPRVVFIKVEDNSLLAELRDNLLPILKQYQIFNSTHKNRGFHPHITVAFRDLKKKDFYPLWNEVKNMPFKEQFIAQGLTLYKHNGKSWDEDEFIPFNQSSNSEN